MSGQNVENRVSVVIAAYNEQERIAATVAAARSLPGVKQVVVVDDGSTDETLRRALDAGAKVVRHLKNRGKAAAMESGANAVYAHEPEKETVLLFLDADLEETALQALPLLEPVLAGQADCTVAIFPPLPGAGGMGFVKRLAAGAIKRATGFESQAPLSGQRCLTWEAYSAALPLGKGWGVEVAMSIRVLLAGYRYLEVPCQMNHRISRNDLRSRLHRLDQYVDIRRQVGKLRRQGLTASSQRLARAQVNEQGAYQLPL